MEQSKDFPDMYTMTLRNGLKVVFYKNTMKPEFYAEILVNSGSKEDPLDATGLAHYLEHLLFKGNRFIGTTNWTEESKHYNKVVELYDQRQKEKDEQKRMEIDKEIDKHSVAAAKYAILNEISEVYKKMGGHGLNASTSKDRTNYFLTLPKNKLEQWAYIESERLKNPVFRLFQWELEIVFEEKNRALDNAFRQMLKASMDEIFQDHPYSNTTLGTSEHLKNPRISKVQEYFDKYYVPNNTSIIITGDLNPSEVENVVNKYFTNWKYKKIPFKQYPKVRPPKSRIYKEIFHQSEPTVFMSYLIPGATDDDAEALTVLDMILDNAQAGLLNLNLNLNQKLKSASSFPFVFKDYGIQFLYGTPKQGQSLEEVEQLLRDQIAKVVTGDFDESLISAIINDFKKKEAQKLEDNETLATPIRNALMYEKDPEYGLKFLDRISKVTKKDVIRVAKKYFLGGYVSVFKKTGQPNIAKFSKPEITPLNFLETQPSEFKKAVDKLPTIEVGPTFISYDKDITIKDLNAKTKIYQVKNPLNNVADIQFIYHYGSHLDRKICTYINALEYANAGTIEPTDFNKRLYSLGLNHSITCDKKYIIVSLSGLEENLGIGLSLLKDLILRPSIDDKKFLFHIEKIIKDRIEMLKEPKFLFSGLEEKILNGEKSDFLRELSNAELKTLTSKDLPAMIAKIKDAKSEILFTGKQSLEEVKKLLIAQYFEQDLTTPTYPEYLPQKYINPKKPIIYALDKKDMKQSHVGILFGSDIVSPDDFVRKRDDQIFTLYFGSGMSSIVFQEIREKRSLGYVAMTYVEEGQNKGEQNLLTGFIGTQSDKTNDAVRAFQELIQNIPWEKDRFDSSLHGMSNQIKTKTISFRELAFNVRNWSQLDYVFDPRQKVYEIINKLSFENFTDFAKKNYQVNNITYYIVGDLQKSNIEELSKNYEVKKLSIKDLFHF
ncbi:MAG: insulinase family protein [Halobacteriovoraceae bacterium]|nr:insulinase family protein [Halobacteriovoraceae bacterium]